MGILSGLKPEAVFEYFEKLCSVPHGSGNTGEISDLCVGFAKEHGLKYRQDDMNNVVIWKDASAGYENAAPVILQGHLDMVCAKTGGCTRDMSKEGIGLVTDGRFIWADQTSLGGDDGIAVAMVLSVLADDTLPHPPIEAVFTSDEETGMYGAAAIDCSDLKGRKLINIDSEDEGIFTVSCAGGVSCDCVIPGEKAPVSGGACYSVAVSGLLGGHSGVEIHKGRASANHLMGRILYAAEKQIGGLRLADIRGGKFDNVICPTCCAQVAVPEEKADEFEELLKSYESVLRKEYAAGDGGLEVSFEKVQFSDAMDAKTSKEMLCALFLLPQGIQEMSAEIPGLVQTSLNLGIIAMKEDGLHFTDSIRSSINSQRELLCEKIRCLVEQAGGSVREHGRYPGWPVAGESALRDTVLDAYRTVSGKEGKIEAIHAGLECGLFIEKIPGLDAISLGPNLSDVHSPDERLDIASVGCMYEVICEILKRSK